jgi:hypothetical protein
MDAYRKFRGLNGCNQSLEVFAGLQFLIKEGLQSVQGKNSKNIVNESVDTNTPACAMPWLDWREAQDVMNGIDDRINVNSKVIEEFQKLEKNNSASC